MFHAFLQFIRSTLKPFHLDWLAAMVYRFEMEFVFLAFSLRILRGINNSPKEYHFQNS